MIAQHETTPAKTIPSLRELPLIGSLPAFSKDRLNFFLHMAQTHGDVCGFHFGPFPGIMFNKPEHIQSILVEHAYDFDKGRALHNAIPGNGIFISEGAFHRRQRKLMAPSFQPRQITDYATSIVQYGERVQQVWRDGATIDVSQQMTALTLSIIGKILFDADVFTETDELGGAMTSIFGYTTYKLSHLLTPPLTWPTPRNQRTRKASQLIRQRIQRLIDERHTSSTERNDFLSILLRARDEDGNAMSDQQLMDECVTLFGAGHETTAAALTWTWYLLCQHPNIYQKLLQEVASVLQDRPPTYADLAHLPYCLQIFKEAMRLYPPAYAISRQALHDIEIDGYPVPKGSMILISPYTLHRDPHYFPHPEQFDPERFTPEREKQLPRYAYLPFGAGPRVCIGNHFAMMEGHLLLATLAQHVTFTLLPGQTIAPDLEETLTLRPYGAVNVVVQRRDHLMNFDAPAGTGPVKNDPADPSVAQ